MPPHDEDHQAISAEAPAPPSAGQPYLATLFLSPSLAWVILVIFLGITTLGWWVAQSYVEQRAHERFQNEVNRAELLITRRMLTFETMLRGAEGLFRASDEVTREDWGNYAAALRLPEFYVGVQGLGFAAWISPGEKAALEERIRSEGFPDFTIKPPGQREEYAPIIYLEPFAGRNLRAFGFDMWREPVRRAAMRRACDSGEPALSGKLTLVQETDVQPGVLLYVPVYRPDQSPNTVADRRAHLRGWVYSPFRMRDLMKGILGNPNPEIGFEIFDGTELSDANQLFDSDFEIHDARDLPAPQPATRQEQRQITFAGQPWTLRFYTRPPFDTATASKQPLLIAASGLVIDALLFAIIWSLAGQGKRAEAVAARMTMDLREAGAQLNQSNKALAAKSQNLAELNEALWRTIGATPTPGGSAPAGPERLTDPERLAALAQTHLMDSLPEKQFDRFTKLASDSLRVPVCLISLVDGERQFFKSAVGRATANAAHAFVLSACRHVRPAVGSCRCAEP